MNVSMNYVNIALDCFCISISALLCFYLKSRTQTSKGSQSFFYICLFNIFFIIGDLSDWCCNGLAKPWYPMALHVGQFLYYFMIFPFMTAFLYYIYHYLSSYKKLSKWYLKIAYGISAVHLIGLLLTPFTGWYYTISADNIYTRGKLIFVASILPVASYIMVMCMTVECQKLLNRRTIISLLSYVWMPLAGQIIQNIFRGMGTLIPAITLSILFIFINIQLDRELLAEKEKQALNEAKMKLMLSQIQPHFLYNTLTTIRHLCDVNPAAAKESINNFSIFLRANMDSLSTVAPIPIEQELEHVKCYLELEQQRFKDILSVEYDLKTLNFSLPALSLQPIAENAVRHGIHKNENGGTLRISTTENDNFYIVLIEDDGIGFTPDYHPTNGHIGIDNVQKRLQMLCNGTLTFENPAPPLHGTIATIKIPKETNV